MCKLVKIQNSQKANDDLIISVARIKQTGNINELLGMSNQIKDCPTIKLNADQYMVKSSGEVREYQHTENRLQNLKSVRATIRKLRDIINTNCLFPSRCKWVTLTYRENMTDNQQLMKDFGNFWKRFVRWCSKSNIPVPEYISVVEPQARGAWHIHLILIWEQAAPYIDNNTVIEQLWSHGFTKTKGVSDVDNLGAYFSAYLADMPLEDLSEMQPQEAAAINAACEVMEKDFTDEQGNTKKKKFIKGARLYLYPPGMNLYRTSQHLRKPLEYEITKRQYYGIVNAYAEGKEKSQLGTLTFSSSSSVIAEDGKHINSINRYYFNTKRHVLNGETKE